MAIMDQNYFREEVVWDGVKKAGKICFSCSTSMRIIVLSSKAIRVLI